MITWGSFQVYCTQRSLTNTLIGTGVHEDHCSLAEGLGHLLTGLVTSMWSRKHLLITWWWLSELTYLTDRQLTVFISQREAPSRAQSTHTHTDITVSEYKLVSFIAWKKSCSSVSLAVVKLWLFIYVLILLCLITVLQLALHATSVLDEFCWRIWATLPPVHWCIGQNNCFFKAACSPGGKLMAMSKVWTGKGFLVVFQL